MSIKVMTHVWEHSKQRSSRLLMLLAIGDNANDEGFAWPSQSTLARKTRMTKRNAQLILDALEETDELIIYNRVNEAEVEQHYSNVYQIVLPQKQELPAELRGQFRQRKQGGSENLYTTVVKTATSEPSIEPSTKKTLSSSGEKPRNEWYDAICDVWKYTGSMNGSMRKMLQGVATAKGWKEYNLEQPLVSPAELRTWAAWYRATQLNGNAKLNMLEKRDVIQSSIGYWQALQQPDAPAADDDDDLPVNNFDKMLEHLGL